MKPPSNQDGQKVALHKRQAVSPPLQGEAFPPERGALMVTYSELFAYSLVIISVVSLVLQFCKRK